MLVERYLHSVSHLLCRERAKPALLVWCLERALSRPDHSRGRHVNAFFILWLDQIALSYSTLMMCMSHIQTHLQACSTPPCPITFVCKPRLAALQCRQSLSVKCGHAPEAQSFCSVLASKGKEFSTSGVCCGLLGRIQTYHYFRCKELLS